MMESRKLALPMNPKMVGGTPHPGPLPIGSADSADAEREKRSQRFGDMCVGFMGRGKRSQRIPKSHPLPCFASDQTQNLAARFDQLM